MRRLTKTWLGLVGNSLLFLYIIATGNSLAHTPGGNDGSSDTPYVSQSGAVQAELILEPKPVTVGQPTVLSLHLRQENKPLGPAKAAIRVELIEDHLPIFEGDLLANDGFLSFALTFVDGSEHRIHVRVRPTEASQTSFSPFEAKFAVAVAPLPPPINATAKSSASSYPCARGPPRRSRPAVRRRRRTSRRNWSRRRRRPESRRC